MKAGSPASRGAHDQRIGAPGMLRWVLCLCLCTWAVAPAAGALSLAALHTNATPGGQVLVSVAASGFTGIGAFQFSMHWDGSVLSYEAVTQTAVPNVALGTPDAQTLTVLWEDTEFTGKTIPAGTALLTLRMRVVGGPSTFSPVTIDGHPTRIEAADFNLELIDVEVAAGGVTIDGPPVIVQQPQSRLVAVGDDASFSVVARGSQPIHFQWRYGHLDLAAATNSLLVLSNAQTADSGDYTAVAANAFGAVTSAVARLTVERPVDAIAPAIAITSPTSSSTFSTTNSTLPLGGTATDNVAVTLVTWDNHRGGGGTAAGTTHWTVDAVALHPGTNHITVTATDPSTNRGTATLTVVYTLPPDTTPPAVAITVPTTASNLSTNSDTIFLAGTAGDNVAVAQVIWSNHRGGGGIATGTTHWAAAGILLQNGVNIITVTAFDSSSNTASATLTVTFDGVTGETVTVSGALAYYPNSPEVLPGVTVNAAGTANLNTLSASDGVFRLVLSRGGDFVVQPLAPASGALAAGVTSVDISLLRRHLVGVGLDSPYKLLAADVSNSRSISSFDITLTRRLVLGLSDVLPSGLWRFVPSTLGFPNPGDPWAGELPPSRSYTNLSSSLTGQNFYAIKMGDLNASWTPCPNTCAPSARLTNEVWLSLTSHTNEPGDTVSLLVQVSQFHNITSLQFTLAWNPAVLRYRSVGAYALNGLAINNFNTAQSASGRLALSWDDPFANAATLPNGTALFSVNLEVVATSLLVSPITLLADAGALPPPEIGFDFQPAQLRWRNGSVTVVGDSGPLIDVSRINYGAPTFTIFIPTISGKRYTLEHTSPLATPAVWQSLPPLTGDGTIRSLTDPAATAQQRFYRVRVE